MASPTQPKPDDDNRPAPNPRRWYALAVLLIAGFMNLIDVTIVNVGLPSLQRNLGATASDIEWVVAGYVLAFALFLLPFGRLGDIIGRKAIFLSGIVGFTFFSALCGLAPSIEWLVAARILQGISSAAMMPQVLAIAQVAFPPHERGLAFSFFGLNAALASVVGPLLGGFLITANIAGLDWRPIFLVNLPVGVLALIGALIVLPNIKGHPGHKLDWIGVPLAGLAVFLAIFPLIEGRELGWPLWTFIMLGLAPFGFGLFYLWERHREKTGKAQLMPVHLVKNRNFSVGTLMMTVLFSGIPGFFFTFAVFLQSGFDFTPLQSGFATSPMPVGILASSILAGRLGDSHIKARIAAAMFSALIGFGFLRFFVTQTADSVDAWQFAIPLVLVGFGMGTAIGALFQAILSDVPRNDAGSASGTVQSFQQLGSAFGVAICGGIFFAVLGQQLTPARFVDAFSHSLIYQLASFTIVLVLLSFIRPPARIAAPAQNKDTNPPPAMNV